MESFISTLTAVESFRFIESILCTSITVWFSSATKSDLRRLRRVVRTAERIIGTTLSSLQELYLSRVSKRAGKIILYPSHTLSELLPSGRRYRALSTKTTRQFLSSNPSHEHLTLNVEHTTLLQLFIHHTYLFFSFQICTSDLFTHNCLYFILCFCYFVHCLFVYSFSVVCVLSFCCTVELLSL